MWEPQYDEEGGVYYVHSETGETSWEDPTNAQSSDWGTGHEFAGEHGIVETDHSYEAAVGEPRSWEDMNNAHDISWEDAGSVEYHGEENEASHHVEPSVGYYNDLSHDDPSGNDGGYSGQPQVSWEDVDSGIDNSGVNTSSWEEAGTSYEGAEASWDGTPNAYDHSGHRVSWHEGGDEVHYDAGTEFGWDHSGVESASGLQGEEEEDIIEEWEEIADHETGGVYYMNTATGETRYDPPGGAPSTEDHHAISSAEGGSQIESTAPEEWHDEKGEGLLLVAEEPHAEVVHDAADTASPDETSFFTETHIFGGEELQSMCLKLASKLTQKVIEKATKNSTRALEKAHYKRMKVEKDFARKKVKDSTPLEEGDPGYEAYAEKMEATAQAESEALKLLEKPMERIDANKNVLKSYSSGSEVCQEVGCSPAQLVKHLKGDSGSIKGMHFRLRGAPTRPQTPADLAELADATEGQFQATLKLAHSPGKALVSVVQHLEESSKSKGLASAPKTVNLNFEEIGDEGAEELAKGLKHSNVTQLYLVKNGISDYGAQKLADALHVNKSLTSLYLTDNQIGDDGITALAQLMAESSLKTLTLSCCPISSKGCQSLAEWIIKPHCQLRALLLGGAAPPKETFAGGSGVAKEDAPPPVPHVGPEGASFLAAALLAPHGCSLRKLWVINSDIGSQGVRSLAAALFSNDVLNDLNISGNPMLPRDANALVHATTFNSSLKSLVCRNCNLSDDMEKALQFAVKARENSENSAADADLAQSLRKDLLAFSQSKLLVFPKKPPEKPLAPMHLRAAPDTRKAGMDTEPVWRRVHDWKDENLEVLLVGPIPLGESFEALSSLRSDLHRAHENLKTRVKDLTSRQNTLNEGLVDTGSKLEEAKRVNRTRAEVWNDRITADTLKSRQAQLSAEYASKQHMKEVTKCSDYESSVRTAQNLVTEARVSNEKDRSESTRKALSDALVQCKFCEGRLLDLRQTIVPRLEATKNETAHYYAECITRLEVVFKDAKKEFSMNDDNVNSLQTRRSEMQDELNLVRRHLNPASDLLCRFSVWLSSFDNYVENAQSAEEWMNLIPVSCGDTTIDNRLRAALHQRNVLKRQFKLAQRFAKGITDSKSKASIEHRGMAMEDVRAHSVRLQLAERNAKRAHVEYDLVMKNPVSEAALSADKGIKPTDLAVARAKQPSEPLAKAALLLSSASATSSQASLNESKSIPKELKRKNTSKFGSSFVERPSEREKVSAQSNEEYERRNDSQSTVRNSKRYAQLMDEAYADLVSMTPSQLRGELLANDLDGTNPLAAGEAQGEELINMLAKMRVARELG